MRTAAVRHHGGNSRRHGHRGRLCAPAQDRRGAMGRDLAVRGRPGADLLAVGDRARDRRRAARHGVGPSAQRALPGVRGGERLDRGGRRQPQALAAVARGARRGRARRGSALHHRRRPHGAPERARGGAEPPLPHQAGAILARCARGQGRAVRPGAGHGDGAARSADDRARDGRRGRALGAGPGKDGRAAGEVLGDAGQGAQRRAALRRGHGCRAARGGVRRRGDRGIPARTGDRLAISQVAPPRHPGASEKLSDCPIAYSFLRQLIDNFPFSDLIPGPLPKRENPGERTMKGYAANATLLFAIGAFLAVAPAFAADRATKDEAVAMVKKAVAYIKAQGPDKAYAEIDNRTGQFVDRDLYVVVYQLDGKVLAHGGNAKFVGKDMKDAQDVDGKYFVKERIELAQKEPTFWQDYKFMDPTTKKVEPKQMYCERLDNTAVCAGIYKP